jgi:hypothetical protein
MRGKENTKTENNYREMRKKRNSRKHRKREKTNAKRSFL